MGTPPRVRLESRQAKHDAAPESGEHSGRISPLFREAIASGPHDAVRRDRTRPMTRYLDMMLKANGEVPASVPQTIARTGEPHAGRLHPVAWACLRGREVGNQDPPAIVMPIHQPWSTGPRSVGRLMYPTRAWAVSMCHQQRVTTWKMMAIADKATFMRTFAPNCHPELARDPCAKRIRQSRTFGQPEHMPRTDSAMCLCIFAGRSVAPMANLFTIASTYVRSPKRRLRRRELRTGIPR